MTSLLVVPQWQGSSVDTARRLEEGARQLAAMVPAARRIDVDVDVDLGTGLAANAAEVRNLDVLVAIAERARGCRAALGDDLVITVGGDCGVELASIGAAAARHGRDLAVVWFDAHADLNLPSSSPSRAFHGMVLRALLGDGAAPLVAVGGSALRASQIVLAGVRELDPAEQAYIARQAIRRVSVSELADPRSVIDAVEATGASTVYVHIDLDVLDPAHFASIGCPAPGGLSPAALGAAVTALARRFALAGLGITEYQPERAADVVTLRALVAGLPIS